MPTGHPPPRSLVSLWWEQRGLLSVQTSWGVRELPVPAGELISLADRPKHCFAGPLQAFAPRLGDPDCQGPWLCEQYTGTPRALRSPPWPCWTGRPPGLRAPLARQRCPSRKPDGPRGAALHAARTVSRLTLRQTFAFLRMVLLFGFPEITYIKPEQSWALQHPVPLFMGRLSPERRENSTKETGQRGSARTRTSPRLLLLAADLGN